MPRSSFGHVRERDNGTWQARYQTPDGRQHAKGSFETKDDASKWLRDEWGRIDRGEWVDKRAGDLTFEPWAEHWKATGLVGLRRTTAKRNVEIVDRYLVPAFGRMRLRTIERATVARWVNGPMSRLAPSTVHKAAQVGSKIMRAAVLARKIPANPFDDVPLPKIEEEEMRFMTPAEIRRLTIAFDRRYKEFVPVAVASGLRAGELFGLRVGRVQGATLDVAEIVTDVGELHFGPPKTRAGRRRVTLPPSVADQLAARIEGRRSDEFVFEAPNGGPMRLSNFRDRFWHPAVERAKLDGLRIHDCRHTAVALWIAAGAQPIEVARRAGHSSVSVVLDRYGHLLPGVDDRLTSALDSFFTE